MSETMSVFDKIAAGTRVTYKGTQRDHNTVWIIRGARNSRHKGRLSVTPKSGLDIVHVEMVKGPEKGKQLSFTAGYLLYFPSYWRIHR